LAIPHGEPDSPDILIGIFLLKNKEKGRDPFESLPSLKKAEELFLLLDCLLDDFFSRGFFLSCHEKSPPFQIANGSRNRAKINLSLIKDYVFHSIASNVISKNRKIFSRTFYAF
jgi:hypothetical protein